MSGASFYMYHRGLEAEPEYIYYVCCVHICVHKIRYNGIILIQNYATYILIWYFSMYGNKHFHVLPEAYGANIIKHAHNSRNVMREYHQGYTYVHPG